MDSFVLNVGSATAVCGVSGEPAPRFVCDTPAAVSRSLRPRDVDDSTEPRAGDEGGGNGAAAPQVLVDAWHDFFSYILITRLHMNNPADRRVVLVVPSVGMLRAAKAAALSALQERLRVGHVVTVPAEPCCAVAHGLTNCLVVDCGASECRVTPVIEGRPWVPAALALPGRTGSALLAPDPCDGLTLWGAISSGCLPRCPVDRRSAGKLPLLLVGGGASVDVARALLAEADGRLRLAQRSAVPPLQAAWAGAAVVALSPKRLETLAPEQ